MPTRVGKTIKRKIMQGERGDYCCHMYFGGEGTGMTNHCAKRLAKYCGVLEIADSSRNGNYCEKIGTSEPILEIERMTTAFRSLVQGIQNDVTVIQRIATGDTTVYVDIKSEEDLPA